MSKTHHPNCKAPKLICIIVKYDYIVSSYTGFRLDKFPGHFFLFYIWHLPEICHLLYSELWVSVGLLYFQMLISKYTCNIVNEEWVTLHVLNLSHWVDITQTHLVPWIANFRSKILNKIPPWHRLVTPEEDSFIL